MRILLLGGGMTGGAVACLAGLVYLVQCRRLKQKRPMSRRFALPSLERSERWNRKGITWAFPLLTCGLAPAASGTTPGVFSAAVMWWVSALLLLARYQPALRGRRMMILTTAAFGAQILGGIGIDPLLPPAPGDPREVALTPVRLPPGRRVRRDSIAGQEPAWVIPTMFQVPMPPDRPRDRDAD